MKKGLIILQARTRSSRLPGKNLMLINNKPMIKWQIDRIQKANVGHLLVATTTSHSDDDFVEFLAKNNVDFFRGNEKNVFQRFKDIVSLYEPDYFIRLTGDCPLVMPDLLIEMNELFTQGNFDYLSNTLEPTFPDGLDVEIVSTDAFCSLSNFNLNSQHLEHVTLGFHDYRDNFRIFNFQSSVDLSNLRWTVDYFEDFIFVNNVFSFFRGVETSFNTEDLLKAIDAGEIQNNIRGGEYRNIALKLDIGEN